MSQKPGAQAQKPATPPARIVKAHSLVRVPGKGWSMITYLIQGDKIIKVNATEPDVRLIAHEHYKRAVAQMLIDDEEMNG